MHHSFCFTTPQGYTATRVDGLITVTLMSVLPTRPCMMRVCRYAAGVVQACGMINTRSSCSGNWSSNVSWGMFSIQGSNCSITAGFCNSTAHSTGALSDGLLDKLRGILRHTGRQRFPASRLQKGRVSPERPVPAHIPRPPSALAASNGGLSAVPQGLAKQAELHDEQVRAVRAEQQVAVPHC